MKKNYFLRIAQSLFLLLLLATMSENGFAQSVVITYPSPAQQITVCNGNSLLTVRLDVTQASSTGGDITINLPSGISYVAGSVAKTAGTASLTITENGGTAIAPVFRLAPNNLAVGDFIVFTVARSASCTARTASLSGTIFKDKITAVLNGVTVAESASNVNSYLVNYPSLSIIQPVAQNNAQVGTDYTRTFNVTNGADGCANAVHFSITYPVGSITQNSLTLAGNAITPTSVVGNTYNYTITGADLTTDQQLCNGETLIFTESFKIKNCPATNTTYNVGWGCSSTPANWCQSASSSASVTMATGTPNFTSVILTNLNYVNMCTPWDVRLRFNNGGTGTGNAAAMYDALIDFGMDLYNNNAAGYNPSPASGYSVTNIRIGNAVAAFTVSGGAIHVNMSQFTSDPDGPGVGLDDLDGDGFYDDLPAGAYIDFIYTYSFECNTTCGNGAFFYHGPTVRLNYKTMCGQTIRPDPKVATDGVTSNGQNYYGQGAATPNSVYPVQVAGGTPFNITLAAGLSSFTLPPSPNMRYVWELTLPAGVTLNGTPSMPFTQSGQVIRFEGTNTSYFNVSNLSFNYTCGVSTSLVFSERLTRIQDSTTGCECRGSLICRDFTVQVMCPVPCATGPTSYQPTVRRTDESLGFTTYGFTTRRTASALTAEQLRRALYLQEIQITGKTLQNNTTDNLHLNFEINKATNGDNKLTPVKAVVTVTRAGAVISTATLTSFDLSASTASKTIVDLNLTSAFPAGTILAGDEAEVVAVYKVSTNDLPNSAIPVLPEGLVWNFYNDSPSGRVVCGGSWIPQMYLIQTVEGRTMIRADIDFSGCGQMLVDMMDRRMYNGTVNLFPNELIPARYIKTWTLPIPAGYEFVSATYGALSSSGTMNLAPFTTVTGTEVTFTNDGSWFSPVLQNGNSYGEKRVQVQLRPTCAAPPVVTKYPGFSVTYNDYYYSNSVPTGQIPTDNSLNTSGIYNGNIVYRYNASTKPAILLTNQTGTLQASLLTESFTVRMASTGTTTAPYNWIAIPDVAGILITEVVDALTNTPVASVDYGNGKMYYLSATGLASGTFKDYKINFKYTTCEPGSFQVLGGWNCGEFPATLDDYLCSKESLTLSFIPAIAEVEIISVSQPTAPVNLCELTDYQFDVNNAQAGSVVNSAFTVTFPIGNDLAPNSFEAEYPKGAGNWQVVPFTQTANTYVFDLTAHSNYPVQGVPGTLNTTISNNRMIGVRFKTTTTCEFISGSKFSIATSANSSCGKAAIGNNIAVESVANNIIGATVDYAVVSSFDIASGSFSNCASPVTFSNISSIILSGTTATSGYIQFEMPAGYDYIPNSLNCSSAQCPTFDGVVNLPNGTKAIKLLIPSGMVSGDELLYNISIQQTSSSICGINTVAVKTFDQANNIACSTAPTGVCDVVLIGTGSNSETYNIVKPQLAFGDFTGSASGNNYSGTLQVENIGTLNQVATNPIIVNFYCADSSGNPIGAILGTHTFAGAIATGASITENFNFTATSVCSPAGNVVVVISEDNNCVCDSIQSAIMVAPACTFEVICPTFSTVIVECYNQIPTQASLTVSEFEALGNANGVIGDTRCGIIEITATNATSPICNGPVIRTYQITEYADINGNDTRDVGENTVLNTASCTQTFTVDRADFTVPANTASTVACASAITAPAVPTITDNCGNILTASAPVISALPACEGTVTYTYTFTDCEGNAHDWMHTFTIEREDFTVPANTVSIIACASAITAPAVPTVTDNCGNTLTASAPVISALPACEGTVTYTYTFTDCEGNAHDWMHTFTIEREDFTVPANTASTVACASAITAPAVPTITDNCGNILTASAPVISALPACEGTVTYTYTFTDCEGNAHDWMHTFTIEREDFTVPANTASTVACASAITAPAVPTVTDNCGNTLTASAPVISALPACEGTVTYTYTFTDCEGNAHDWMHTFTIEREDFTVPANTASTVACASAITAPAVPTVTDNCGNILAASAPVISVLPACEGTVTYTYTFTDCEGNAHDWLHTFTIEREDFTVPANTASTVACASAITAPAVPTVTDNCGNILTASAPVISALPACEGTVTYTYTFTDCEGNAHDWMHTFTIEREDFTVPANTVSIIACASAITAPAVPTVTDNCGNILTASAPVISALPACEGTVTYTYTFTDCEGNAHDWMHTFTIEREDFTVPANTASTVACASAITAPAVPTVTDNCGNILTASAPVISVLPGCEGTVTYTYTFTDCEGNAHDWMHIFTIEREDFTVPANTASTVACASAITAPAVPTVTDNCGNILAASAPVISALPGCEGTVTYTYTFTDCEGNANYWMHTFTVDDTLAPTGTAPANIALQCISEIPLASVDVITDEADNCNGSVTITVFDMNNGGTGCLGNPYIVTRTFTLTDCSGLSTNLVQTITVEDITAPIFVEALPQDAFYACDAIIPVATTLTATDNCSVAPVTFNEQIVSGGCAGSYDIVRTWTATDVCGNTNVHTQIITIEDITAPTFVESLPENGFEECDKIPMAPVLTAIDNCGTVTVTFNEVETDGYCSFMKVVTRTWTATDDCGNSTVHTQTLDVSCPVIVYNALTPNDDGLNDIFLLDGIDCYPNNEVIIYNRWGVEVFGTKGYDNTTKVFRGYSEGRTTISADSKLPTGTYFYILKYEFKVGETLRNTEKSGYLYINGN